jgi:ubiquinone/menaquinone biosynthesis C-methylase UbiE
MAAPTDYDTIAPRYAAEIDSRPWNALYERPATLALLPDVEGMHVLDAGCGSGWYADWLVRHGANVVAVDRSAQMVTLAERRLNGRAQVMQGDVSALASLVHNGTFDLIVSSLVLHYLADLPAIFAEWARVLKPGGSLVFSTHHPVRPASLLDPGYLQAQLIEERWGWLGEMMRYYQRPLCDLTEPLAAAGFVIERMCEPTPSDELKSADPKGYDRLSRLPPFIFVRARRDA